MVLIYDQIITISFHLNDHSRFHAEKFVHGAFFSFKIFILFCFFSLVFWQVEEGIELGALENIPGSQRVDLYSLLGSQFPIEVVQNLQRQIDSVGRY